MAYTASEHAIVYLNTMSVAELVLPSTSTSSAGLGMGRVGMGALSGLGGYVSLGLGGKAAKPSVIQLSDGEVLITKDCKLSLEGLRGSNFLMQLFA